MEIKGIEYIYTPQEKYDILRHYLGEVNFSLTEPPSKSELEEWDKEEEGWIIAIHKEILENGKERYLIKQNGNFEHVDGCFIEENKDRIKIQQKRIAQRVKDIGVIKKYYLWLEVARCLSRLTELNLWLKGALCPFHFPTLAEIEEKEAERAEKYSELLKLLNIQQTSTFENTNKIIIPIEVLKWLSETISKNGNGKAFIEKCNGKLKWLQNKQNARVLLTHKAIKGNLSKNKAIEQAPTLFIYGDNDEPLKLGTNDKRQENANTDDLRNYLNGLKNPTP